MKYNHRIISLYKKFCVVEFMHVYIVMRQLSESWACVHCDATSVCVLFFLLLFSLYKHLKYCLKDFYKFMQHKTKNSHFTRSWRVLVIFFHILQYFHFSSVETIPTHCLIPFRYKIAGTDLVKFSSTFHLTAKMIRILGSLIECGKMHLELPKK